ncbi:MAG TPA: hypothetical protein VGK20_02750 [Candidatus Binatia bacterium]|jgi:hypothetical protein
MKQSVALLVVPLALLAACSKQDTAAPAGNAAAPAAAEKPQAELAKIPMLPGYKYYVGGPLMKQDPYGHFRIGDFLGEVEQPPSRGMIFGARRDGDKMEYRVWGNGILLGVHRGVFRDGVFWQDYAEGYRDGKLVARENDVNIDEEKRTKETTEDIDPQTGEVIRTKVLMLSYLPPNLKPDGDIDDEDTNTPPDKAAAPAPPPAAAPAPAAGDAAK